MNTLYCSDDLDILRRGRDYRLTIKPLFRIVALDTVNCLPNNLSLSIS